MLTRRWLPHAEWAEKLKGTPCEAFAAQANPSRTNIVVVEDDGRVVACWAFPWVLHAEGLWADHATREVWAHLFGALNDVTRQADVPTVLTASDDEKVDRMLTHEGAEAIPAQFFALPVPAGPFVRRKDVA